MVEDNSISGMMMNVDIQDPISKLVQHTSTCTVTDPGSKAYEIFEQQPALEGIVVLDKLKPAGLVMRSDFYQKIGTQYGYSLFIKKPVSHIMELNMLIVDDTVEISKVSSLAMKRDNKNMYDLIVIAKNDIYVGVVSIRLFLIELSQKREKQIELLKIANQKEKALSDAIAFKNDELCQKNDSIKNLLDHAGQGFLTFTEGLSISSEYSVECVKIFGFEIVDYSFIDIIRPHYNESVVDVAADALDMFFHSHADVSPEVYFSLLPQEMKIHGKTIALEYKLINDISKKIMVILTDISERVELTKKMQEEEKNLRLIIKAIVSYDDLKMSMDELCESFNNGFNILMQESQDPSETISEILRIVHTYKGELAQYGLYNSSMNLNAIEEELSLLLSDVKNPMAELKKFINTIDAQAIIAQDLQVIADALGDDYFIKNETYKITKEQLEEIDSLIKQVCSEAQQSVLEASVKRLLCRNIKDFLKDYDGYVDYLSIRLGKNILPLNIVGDDIFIYKPLYSGVIKSLVHIIRNSVDHGIESADDRIEAGKSEYAVITCKIVQTDPHNFTLSISDDGQGINLEKIKDKALKNRIITSNELVDISVPTLLTYVFMDHFTTKTNVDMVSGRGMGLSAVKNEVEKLGGHIAVSTRDGEGTEFLISLPIINDFNIAINTHTAK